MSLPSAAMSCTVYVGQARPQRRYPPRRSLMKAIRPLGIQHG